jgi:3-hydroxybutyryl-CoA dehydrogenase
LMDLIGIDVNLAATQSVFEQTFGEPRYRPHPIQRRKVLQGRLGRKTGAGFYTYPTGEGEELPKLPTAATDAGPFVVSQGTWAPGLQAQLRSAGKLAEKARDAQAGFVAAGRAEDLASLLAALDGDLPADRVLLCQSTDITLHEASQWAVHPERLVGFDGWFLASGDVAVLTKGPATTSESCASAEEVVRSLGKLPLWVDDPPGMVAPRVVAMLVNEAAFAMGEGVAEEATIDRAMELGVRHPQGPIRWGRSLGFQRVLAVLEQLQREFGEERYRPAPWLRRQVRTGTSAQANG